MYIPWRVTYGGKRVTEIKEEILRWFNQKNIHFNKTWLIATNNEERGVSKTGICKLKEIFVDNYK